MKIAESLMRWIPLAIIAFALVSIFVLLQMDVVVNGDLYSYGLQFSLDWANRYWLTIRTALTMLSLITFSAVGFQISTILHKDGKKTKSPEDNGIPLDKNENTYKLSDGSTIKIKTALKGVKRLNTFTADGKPTYAVKADNIVEVLDAPRQLMRPLMQEYSQS